MDSCYKKKRQEDAYRIYDTDWMKAFAHIETRYADIAFPQKEVSAETQAQEAEEVKDRIFAKLNAGG